MPLLRVVMKVYHLHMFLSLADLNIQKSLNYSNTRTGNTHAESKTEPSSSSRPPAPERTNTNHSLNIQTEKDVKEPNSAPPRGVLCTQGACRETCLNTEFDSSCSCTDKYIQNYVKIPILESFLEKKTVGYVSSMLMLVSLMLIIPFYADLRCLAVLQKYKVLTAILVRIN